MSVETDSADHRPPKPEPLPVRYDGIPAELKDRNRWVCWRYVWKADREEWTKVPINPATGSRAKANESDTWDGFETAKTFHESDTDTAGLGFVFASDGPFVGVDIDDARNPETRSPSDVAKEIVNELESFTEVSPSGTGYHVYVVGELPDDAKKRTGKIEIYQERRFFTVTGHRVDTTPKAVKERHEPLQSVHGKHVADDPDTDTDASSNAPDTPTDIPDEELIRKAKNAKDGEKFRRLWNGNIHAHDGKDDSHSGADLALCDKLAFWTGGDRSRIDRLFRQSDLYRDKWDRDDYRKRTIDKALSGKTEYYDPGHSNADSSLPAPSNFAIRNGGYAKFHPPRDDDDESGTYEQITNFQIETLSRLTHRDESLEYHLRIHPADGEPYELHVEPVVFNDLRRFRREVLGGGWTPTFDGGQSDLHRLKEFIGEQPAKERTGTKLLGLHGDEFVTPDGSLTVDGWSDDPDTVFTDVETPLATALSISPDDGAEYDTDAVQAILRLLPQTRTPERFLPVLGWFYAAPFRPHIQEWSGEFNILNVLGDTGSGKTSTLETLWRAFGVDEEMPEAKATPFSIMRTIASSNALPVIFDEYKPAEIREYKLDELHSNLRASTRGGVVTKGRADMGVDTYRLHAPVCISGEQPIQGPAEERRTILTVFKRDVTVGETHEQEAYAQLVGGEANGTWYDGYDLRNHALAYYRWLLEQPADDVRTLWENSRRHVMSIVDDLSCGNLDDMVIQGFQTIKFGTTLYRAFADDMGIDPDTTGVTSEAVDDAIRYVADSGTGADHTSHLDRLLGLMNRAARSGYLSDGEHYKVVRESEPDAELRVHLPTAFDQVRRYARDHDLRGDDLLSSAGDYKARIRDAADDPTSYVTTASQNTPPLNRCVGIHVRDAADLVADFEPEAFGVEPGGGTETTDTGSRFDPQPLHRVADDPTGYPTVKGEVKTVEFPESDDAPAIKATLVNGQTAIDVIAWTGVDGLTDGEQVIIENAATSEFDGNTQLVIKDGVTAIHPAPDESQQQIDDPETHGGDRNA